MAVSPIVTVEPRRRKFHKAITLSLPAPRAHSQGMINQYSGSAPTLRLLCSITGTYIFKELNWNFIKRNFENIIHILLNLNIRDVLLFRRSRHIFDHCKCTLSSSSITVIEILFKLISFYLILMYVQEGRYFKKLLGILNI